MVEYIPAPDPYELLRPLLACLPTAFLSPKPPPALLPLLSPVLRQRVQLLSSVSSAPPEKWIRLLCWDSTRAAQLEEVVGNTSFDPHPVSGEIEIPDDIQIAYKQVDQETLRSRLPLQAYDITVVYLWCPGDAEGGGPGWRVAEVLPLDALRNEDDSWFESIGEANEHRQERILKEALDEAESDSKKDEKAAENEEADDDDAYWAQYDGTPAATPGPKQPVAPRNTEYNGLLHPQPTAEESYFGRYADVQPALDSDDPSVDRKDVGESSLNGGTIAQLLQRYAGAIDQQQTNQPGEASTNQDRELYDPVPNADAVLLSHPRPASASSGSDAVSRLEQTAETQSASEMGVKQHISCNIKSLFRLARSTGISKAEFASLVERELEVLDLLDPDDE
jgi:hypothetical protein